MSDISPTAGRPSHKVPQRPTKSHAVPRSPTHWTQIWFFRLTTDRKTVRAQNIRERDKDMETSPPEDQSHLQG